MTQGCSDRIPKGREVGHPHGRGPFDFDPDEDSVVHFHAQVGGDESKPVLDYLQGIKEIELRPIPFLK